MSPKSVGILRHGKSDWDTDLSGDLARPLAERGRRSAAAGGGCLAATAHGPELGLCSPATRARQTTDLATGSGAWSSRVEICEDLYFGGSDAVLDLLRQQPDEVEASLLVGHEPAASELIASLVGGGRHRMPTAGLARVAFDTARWSHIGPGLGRLEWLVPSRLLLSIGI